MIKLEIAKFAVDYDFVCEECGEEAFMGYEMYVNDDNSAIEQSHWGLGPVKPLSEAASVTLKCQCGAVYNSVVTPAMVHVTRVRK